MKALFVYSNKYERCNGLYYSMTQNADVWQKRYLPLFDELVVFGRVIDVNNVVGKKMASTDRVSFSCTKYNINSSDFFTHRGEIDKQIEKLVKETDFLIARQSYYASVAVKYAKKYNIPYVVEVVGSTWDSYWNFSVKGKVVAPYFELLARRMIREAPYVVYVTNEYLQKMYPTKGKSIGISNVEINAPDPIVLNKRLCCKHENNIPINLCTVAAVDVPYKGQKYVIKAMAILKKRGLKTYYYVIGDGDQRRLISVAKKCKVADRVFFTGAVNRDEVFNYMDLSDIYIQPSLQEGLPRAMIEAMSRAMPAIGFRTAGIPELIDGEFVCEKQSISGLVRCIEKLVNKDVYCEQSLKNFEKSKEYCFEILNKKRHSFYREVIS